MRSPIAILALATLLVASNAFSFGSIGNAFKNLGNDVKHGFTDAGNKIKSVATQGFSKVESFGNDFGNDVKGAADGFKSDITQAADTFAKHIDSLPGDMKSEFQYVGKKITKLADQAADIAPTVLNDIEEGAEAVASEAEKIAKDLAVPLACIESLLENAQLFLRMYEVSEDPSQLIVEWNPATDEIFDICVACSGESESKFEWIKKIQLKGKDIDVAMCAADVISFATSAGEMASVEGDLDPMVILEFVNSIIDMSQDCPSAIEFVEGIVDGTATSSGLGLKSYASEFGYSYGNDGYSDGDYTDGGYGGYGNTFYTYGTTWEEK